MWLLTLTTSTQSLKNYRGLRVPEVPIFRDNEDLFLFLVTRRPERREFDTELIASTEDRGGEHSLPLLVCEHIWCLGKQSDLSARLKLGLLLVAA